MRADGLREKLIDYIQDVHALEQNVLRMLDAMLATTGDAETLNRLRRHRVETERHERLIRQRLAELGASPSLTAEVPAIAGAWLKGLVDRVRADKPGKNARDVYVTEHVEIAAYALLEHLALRAGDFATADVARSIRAEEEEMAHWIADRWGRFVDLTLDKAGLLEQIGPPRSGGGPWQSGGSRPQAGTPLVTTLSLVGLAAGLGAVGYLLLGGDSSRRGARSLVGSWVDRLPAPADFEATRRLGEPHSSGGVR